MFLFFISGTAFALDSKTTPDPRNVMGEEVASPAAEFQTLVAKETGKSSARSLIAKAMRALDPKKGKGWAIVKTETIFPEPLMQRFYRSVTQMSQIDSAASKMLKEMGEEDTDVRTLTPEQVAPLQEYASWLAKRMNESLGKDEPIEVSHLDVRLTSNVQGIALPGPWHLDTEYLTADVTLFGEGTQVLPDTPKLTAETFAAYKPTADKRRDAAIAHRGETLIFSGLERAAAMEKVHATVHRGAAVQNRVFLVIRFARVGGTAAPSPAKKP